MPETLVERIDALDDRQASHIATSLARDIFSRWKTRPGFDQLAVWAEEQSKQVEAKLTLSKSSNWNARTLVAGDAGAAARSVLKAWAADENLAPVVEAALAHYARDETADLGVISIGVAIGLTYLLISGNVELDLGFVRLKKSGLTSKQQASVIKKTFGPLAKLVGKAF